MFDICVSTEGWKYPPHAKNEAVPTFSLYLDAGPKNDLALDGDNDVLPHHNKACYWAIFKLTYFTTWKNHQSKSVLHAKPVVHQEKNNPCTISYDSDSHCLLVYWYQRPHGASIFWFWLVFKYFLSFANSTLI